MRTLILCALVIASPVFAEERPLLAIPGNLVYAESFSVTPQGWQPTMGKWKPGEGGLCGSEMAIDNHGAVFRMDRSMKDFIIQYEVKLDGAKGTSLSVNDAQGHLARISVSPTHVGVTKDDHDKDGPDESVPFGTSSVNFAPGTWHTVRMEIVGDEMLGKVDGFVACGKHAQLSAEKTNLALTVGGETASFRDFKIWEATPNPEFKKVQAKTAKTESRAQRRTRRSSNTK